MQLSATWRKALSAPHTPKAILVTLALSRDAGRLAEGRHIATLPGALRYATARNVTTSDGYPFWPLLSEWPVVTYRIAPEERRFETPQVDVRVIPHSFFPNDALKPGSAISMMGRIDLWTPNTSLDTVIPLVQGPVIAASRQRRGGGISFTIRDGEPSEDVDFPANELTFTREDFLNAPEDVIGRARRLIIMGPFPYPIPAVQIDAEGRLFYLMEPPVSGEPTEFYVGGNKLERDFPSVKTMSFPNQPERKFTALEFRESVNQTSFFGDVSAAGGLGIMTTSPIMLLLRDVGGYELTGQAESLLNATQKQFTGSALFNQGAKVLEIVRERLLPQTTLAMTFRMGRIHAVDLGGVGSDRQIAVGQGLRWRIQNETTSLDSANDVYNIIVVKYNRTITSVLSNPMRRGLFVLDEKYGGSIGSILAASQHEYGRRVLEIDAADIYENDDDGDTPESVRQLGELEARLHAYEHRKFTYDCDWLDGMGMDVYDRRLLTDSDEELEDEPVRVVEWSLLATGPRLTFQTEDAAA